MNPRPRTMSTKIRAVRDIQVPPPAGLFDDEEPTHPTAESTYWERRATAIARSASCFAVNGRDPWTARIEAARWHEDR